MRLGSVQDLVVGAGELRRWRCGRIVMAGGKLIEVQHRPWPASASIAQVWCQARFGRWEEDRCLLDYHQPLGMPRFLTLDYIRSGARTRYKTFLGAAHLLDEIARLRGAQGIVAHITNDAISDRLLQRLGWERHLDHWHGRHWIKRFYEGYPDRSLGRYLINPPRLATSRAR